jgi:hypothetical protein
VSLNGKTAVRTGAEAQRADWAGARSGLGYSVQGNGLVGANVIAAMEVAFLKTPGTLGERLLAALSAGDAAGGQKTGRESAALLVKTQDGWPNDIDLRVDDSADPVGGLRTLFGMQSARQQLVQARRAARGGDLQGARALIIQAVAGALTWPRIWLQAAEVAMDIEEPELALQYLNVAFSRNAAWAEAEIGDGIYCALGRDPLLHISNDDGRVKRNFPRFFFVPAHPSAGATAPCCLSFSLLVQPARSARLTHQLGLAHQTSLRSLRTMMIYSNSPHLGEAGSPFKPPVTAPQDHCANQASLHGHYRSSAATVRGDRTLGNQSGHAA